MDFQKTRLPKTELVEKAFNEGSKTWGESATALRAATLIALNASADDHELVAAALLSDIRERDLSADYTPRVAAIVAAYNKSYDDDAFRAVKEDQPQLSKEIYALHLAMAASMAGMLHREWKEMRQMLSLAEMFGVAAGLSDSDLDEGRDDVFEVKRDCAKILRLSREIIVPAVLGNTGNPKLEDRCIDILNEAAQDIGVEEISSPAAKKAPPAAPRGPQP